MKKTIIVIDDDRDILDALSILLEDIGYEPYLMQQPEGLLQIIEEKSPGLILLDVLLSGSDGREVSKSLKENVKTKSIPIIMLSAHPHAAQSTLEELHADDFIEKPFETSVLIEKIQKFML